MKHYDGPAFFRRYYNQNGKTSHPTKFKSPRTNYLQSTEYQLLKKPLSKSVQNNESSINKLSTPLENVGNPVKWSRDDPFRLSTVPKQLQRIRQQPLVDFEKLKLQFEKPNDSVFVFFTDQNNPATPEQRQNYVEESDKTTFNFSSDTQSYQSITPKINESNFDDIQKDKKQSITNQVKAQSSVEQTKNTDCQATHNSDINNPHESKSSSIVSTNTSNTDVGLIYNQSSDSENYVDSMLEPSSVQNHSVQDVLKNSFGDILNEEKSSTKHNDLLFVQDKHLVSKSTVSKINLSGYQYPDVRLLNPPVYQDENEMDGWIEHQGEILDATLHAFHVDAHVADWTIGPTVTQFQVSLSLGVKVNKITKLTDDLKLALAAKDILIEAPIPGRTTVGIEIPNLKTRPVMLSEVVQSETFKNSISPLTVALGVDLFGKPQVIDLRTMPHGLIAGATGSGKSIFINSLLLSLLYKATPAELKLILIDPKAVEFLPYEGLPHLLSPVISDPKAAAATLKWAVKEMDERYERLSGGGVRNIEQFNERAKASESYGLKMPYIVIVIDELADLMMTASSEVQDYIIRITQKARAAGIHLLVATQRPSVDIVTGVIKNNIPTRVAFMVSSQIDSRTILDSVGAERLLGKGDMLYLGNGAAQPVRLQGTFVEDEIDRVTDFVRTQGEPNYAFDPNGLLKIEQVVHNQDELMPKVLDFIVNEHTVSTSKLQRVFSIGYNRAANLIDTLESKSYISQPNGSKPRDVFLTPKRLAEISIPQSD